MSRISRVESSQRDGDHNAYHRPNPRDHITNLPDGILGHILSRLPIKDAMRTCVLSKNWEFKWALMYNVVIHHGNLSRGWRNETLDVNIVERILHHVHHIEKFSLCCILLGQQELSRIATLTSAILRRNIKCLQLRILSNQGFVLPRSLLNCTSLIELNLHFVTPCSFKVPVNNCFPNLQSMSLTKVKILNGISNMDTLVFTFPVLKVLELDQCEWLKVKYVEFYVPSLRTFMSVTPSEFDDSKDIDYLIKVRGAKIVEFQAGGYPENIIMIGSTVGFACLVSSLGHQLLLERRLQVRKLLRELSSVKYLCIMHYEAIRLPKLGLPLPRFLDLKELNLVMFFDAEGLLELLYAAPFLKSLRIFAENREDFDYESVKPLPSCVVHHLEKVGLIYTQNRMPEFLIEKFLLKNAVQLKTLSVGGYIYEASANEMVEKLSLFPKASQCLKIIVSEIVGPLLKPFENQNMQNLE